jgi:hypothetical protein
MDAVPALPFVLAVALAVTPITGVPAVAAVECEVTDATLTWGFKDSFRAYIDGDIANGEWTTSGDASYETPVFTWSGGTGQYVPLLGTGTVSFSGSVRFTGHDGVLDTTIADPVFRLAGDSAVLSLDVSGPTMDGDQIDQQDVAFVEAPTAEVVGGDAVRTVEVATVLTEDGAIAFPNYEAGEAFDPVLLSMTVGKTRPNVVAGDLADEHDDGWPALMGPLAGGIVFVLVTIAGIFFATRRRRDA